MGYSTAIYAVDLNALKASVGSGDAKLIQRLKPSETKGSKDDPNFGPRVWYTKKKKLLLNGKPVTWEELIAELRQPQWEGTNIYLREDVRWKKDPTAFFNDIDDACSDGNPKFYLPEGTVPPGFNNKIAYFRGCHFGADDDEWYGTAVELTEEQAAAELVEGQLSQPKLDYMYGYGLKRLCDVLGSYLTSIEGSGFLKKLKLDTPLSKKRSPIPLTKPPGEFPVIGYLTADEVRSEVDRLSGMDLSYAKDDEIEEDRKEVLKALKKAAKKNVGVVAFYH